MGIWGGGTSFQEISLTYTHGGFLHPPITMSCHRGFDTAALGLMPATWLPGAAFQLSDSPPSQAPTAPAPE